MKNINKRKINNHTTKLASILFPAGVWLLVLSDYSRLSEITTQDTFVWKWLVSWCVSVFLLQILFLCIGRKKYLNVDSIKKDILNSSIIYWGCVGPFVIAMTACGGFELFLVIQRYPGDLFYRMNDVDFSQFYPIQLQYLGFLLCATLVCTVLCFALKKPFMKLIESGGYVVIFGVAVVSIGLLRVLMEYIIFRIYHHQLDGIHPSYCLIMSSILIGVFFVAHRYSKKAERPLK